MTINGKTPPVECSPPASAAGLAGSGRDNRGKPGRLAALPRRILVWSGNLLATAVIVILSLTFGNQVLYWWRDDAPERSGSGGPANRRLESLGDSRIPHLLAFGDLPFSLERMVFEGTEQAALARLRANCRAVAKQFDSDRRQAMPISQSFLRQLDEREAVEHGEGWRILQQGGPLISVIALRCPAPGSSMSKDQPLEIAESVVSWGLGFRAPVTRREAEASQSRWTLFTCSGQRKVLDSDLEGSQRESAIADASNGSRDRATEFWKRGTPPGGDPSLFLPPQSRRTLGIRIQGGDGLLGFVNAAGPAFNRDCFDERFERRGWDREFGWTKVGRRQHARFRKSDTGVCDIQLHERTDGGTRGILTVTLPASDAEE